MIVFAVCIHLKNSTITPPKCTVLCFKGWKVKNTTLSNVVYTIMHIIFIRYLKKEKKMTTPPTRFHQNNKIIRYIHTKNCQNHSPFTNPHSPLHHPTLLGIYEKKVDYSQFSWSQAQQIYCCFSFNKEKKNSWPGRHPSFLGKYLKYKKPRKILYQKLSVFS